MLTTKSQEMFAAVARAFPALREFLNGELTKHQEVLELSLDETQLRRAQGQVACLRGLIKNLDASFPDRR